MPSGSPLRPDSGTAVAQAIAYVWITEDTYDKDYVAKRTVGFEEFKNHILGKDDGTTEDSRVGFGGVGYSREKDKGPRQGMGFQKNDPFRGHPGRRGKRLPAGLRDGMGEDDDPPPGDAGSGQARG